MTDDDMTWNHRILRGYRHGEYFYAVHEVYYTDGVPDSWTQEPISLVWESLADGIEELAMIRRAIDKPVLEVVGDKLQIAGEEVKTRDP